jgi:hypothetical protein
MTPHHFLTPSHPVARLPGAPIPLPRPAPKYFSNHWKTAENFFQSLEKSAQIFQPLENIFPIIGKITRNFPTIGKKFSNHWKTPASPSGGRWFPGTAPGARRTSPNAALRRP